MLSHYIHYLDRYYCQDLWQILLLIFGGDAIALKFEVVISNLLADIGPVLFNIILADVIAMILYHRARTVCSNPDHLQNEEKHLFKSLNRCKYPNWALNRVKIKSQTAQKKNNPNSKKPAPNNSRGPKTYIVVPYHQGLSESYKRTCKKYGIEGHLKGGHTIKDLLMAPKDKDPILKRSGVIYRFKCGRVDCDHE